MVNRGIPALYAPRLDQRTKEEKFLLKQRMRLIEKIHDLKVRTDKIGILQREHCERRLKRNEKKLGIKSTVDNL